MEAARLPSAPAHVPATVCEVLLTRGRAGAPGVPQPSCASPVPGGPPGRPVNSGPVGVGGADWPAPAPGCWAATERKPVGRNRAGGPFLCPPSRDSSGRALKVEATRARRGRQRPRGQAGVRTMGRTLSAPPRDPRGPSLGGSPTRASSAAGAFSTPGPSRDTGRHTMEPRTPARASAPRASAARARPGLGGSLSAASAGRSWPTRRPSRITCGRTPGPSPTPAGSAGGPSSTRSLCSATR